VRHTVEAIVGAVIGSLAVPERLVHGYYDDAGTLIVAGSTSPLSPRQRTTIVRLLRKPSGPHPWPTEMPTGRLGHYGRDRITVAFVDPTLVDEVSADSAYEHGRWRYLTRFIRPRPTSTPTRSPHQTTVPKPDREGPCHRQGPSSRAATLVRGVQRAFLVNHGGRKRPTRYQHIAQARSGRSRRPSLLPPPVAMRPGGAGLGGLPALAVVGGRDARPSPPASRGSRLPDVGARWRSLISSSASRDSP